MDTKTICLGALALGEASGYEIRKMFEDGPFAHFAQAAYGSIYPALTKLAEDGLVTGKSEAQEKRPDKKVYRLTPSGWDHLEQALQAKIPTEDKVRSDTLFILFFTEWQRPDWIARVVDARIDHYRSILDGMQQCIDREAAEPEHSCATTSQKLVRGFGHAVYQAAYDYLVENRDAFIAAAGQRRNDRREAAE